MTLKTSLANCIVLLLFPVSLYATDYSIPEVRIDVTIDERGIVNIREHRTYRFNGSFSWADYRLPDRHRSWSV